MIMALMGSAFLAPQATEAPVPGQPAQPGVSFANPDMKGMQIANMLGMLAQAYGQQTGTGGQVGGAVSQLAQQGIAGKNVGTLAGKQDQEKLTGADQHGPTTETMKRNADGTYTRTITGLDTEAKGSAGASPGTAFGAPVQRPFNQPTTQAAPAFEGLGGLPIAAQMQLLEQQRAGQTAQRAAQGQEFEQATQMRKEALNPIIANVTGADGQQYAQRRNGDIEPMGIGTYQAPAGAADPTQWKPVQVSSGPGGEKTTMLYNPVTQETKPLGTGTPQATGGGGLSEAQMAEGPAKVQKLIADATSSIDKKGKRVERDVTVRDVEAINKAAELYKLPYRYKAVKLDYAPWAGRNIRRSLLFQQPMGTTLTGKDIYEQLISTHGKSTKQARAIVNDMAKKAKK